MVWRRGKAASQTSKFGFLVVTQAGNTCLHRLTPHSLFQCSLLQSLLIRGGFSPPSLTQGGWGESIAGDPLANSTFIRGDFHLGNGIRDHCTGCLRRSLYHVGFKCAGHELLRTAFHSRRDQNRLHFQSGWRPNLALQGWQLLQIDSNSLEWSCCKNGNLLR